MAARLLTREQLSERLAPYACRLIQEQGSGLEFWVTGWNYPFTLTPEPGSDGRYDEWQYFRILAEVIGKTMPQDWKHPTDV